jgi:hypothetical protein
MGSKPQPQPEPNLRIKWRRPGPDRILPSIPVFHLSIIPRFSL